MTELEQLNLEVGKLKQIVNSNQLTINELNNELKLLKTASPAVVAAPITSTANLQILQDSNTLLREESFKLKEKICSFEAALKILKDNELPLQKKLAMFEAGIYLLFLICLFRKIGLGCRKRVSDLR